MQITYQIRCDLAYCKTVIDRQYQQTPFLLRLPIQFGILGAAIAAFAAAEAVRYEIPIAIGAGLSLVCFCLTFFGGIATIKQAIMLKFKRRPGFGSEATITLSDQDLGVATQGAEVRLAWSVYASAVRFDDGILLKRARSVRWLPDTAIHTGSASEATALIRSKMALRQIH